MFKNLKKNYFTLKELTAIKSKLQDLTREVERLNNVRNPTPKSLSNNKKTWIARVSYEVKKSEPRESCCEALFSFTRTNTRVSINELKAVHSLRNKSCGHKARNVFVLMCPYSCSYET